MRAQIDLARRQYVWEWWKGFATLIGAVTVFIGGVIAVGHWVHPDAGIHIPDHITVTLSQPAPAVKP